MEVMSVGAVAILMSSSLLMFLLVNLIKFFHKVWWIPMLIQKLLGSQGIKGPPYRFLHGSNQEVLNLRRESMKTPMELTHDILPRVHPHIHLWIKLYGRNFITWYGCKPQLYITEPDLIKEVLNDRNGVYMKIKPEDYLKKLLVVTAEGKKWSTLRKLAIHAFHIENLKGMAPTMIASVETMLEKWGYPKRKEIEVFEEFKVLTSDVISKTAFGTSYLEGHKIFEMLTKLVSIVATNAHRVKLPGLGKFIKSYADIEAKKLDDGIRESFIQIIRIREAKIQNGELDGNGSDYLGLLLNAYQDKDENKRISINDMIDECKTFYFAGHLTITGLLTWTMFLLSIHTDWQEKAREEVFDLFGENHPNTEDNNIAKMKMMTMIINETLRLYPPALDLRRKVATQVRLGDILLPPNIEIIIPPLVCHSDPQIWGEDVHLFKPDRFSEGVSKAAKNTNAYLPFGMGPRSCVGSNFATTEVKLALSMILQRYAFTLSPSYVHSPIQHITTHPQHGVHIILRAL